MKLVIKASYYIGMAASLLLFTVVIPHMRSSGEGVAIMNKNELALSAETGSRYSNFDDPRHKEILRQGRELEIGKYKAYSNIFGLIICTIALSFSYFFKYSGRNDPLYFFLFFGLMYLLGSIEVGYFLGILAMSLAAHFFKLRKERYQKI